MNHQPTGTKNKLTLTAGIAALLLTAGLGHAAVVITLTDDEGVPNVGAGPAGQTFAINVKLQSTAELTTGLTYFLRDPDANAGNYHFEITSRNITGSPYSERTSSDSAVATSPASRLDSDNDLDLGAGVFDLNSPLGIGTFFVAKITFFVLPTTPAGNYTIELTPNTVVAGPAPVFPEFPPQRFSYTVVTPVPEPATASLLLLGGLFFGGRTRFRTTIVR